MSLSGLCEVWQDSYSNSFRGAIMLSLKCGDRGSLTFHSPIPTSIDVLIRSESHWWDTHRDILVGFIRTNLPDVVDVLERADNRWTGREIGDLGVALLVMADLCDRHQGDASPIVTTLNSAQMLKREAVAGEWKVFDERMGICNNLHGHWSGAWCMLLGMSWEKHSGEIPYPIFAPSCEGPDGRWQYNNLDKKWDLGTGYGAMRLDYLDHLITRLNEAKVMSDTLFEKLKESDDEQNA